jgi:hypothetical protein
VRLIVSLSPNYLPKAWHEGKASTKNDGGYLGETDEDGEQAMHVNGRNGRGLTTRDPRERKDK